MPKSIKSISNPQLSLNILKTQDIKTIHNKTIEIIENVGVRFPSARALDIWEESGAIVDRDAQVIRASGELIESALQKAPP